MKQQKKFAIFKKKLPKPIDKTFLMIIMLISKSL